ncbi:uncharacterized protein LOC118763326 isoform X2 [Octopus sinensis]|uniref:Uncharacterized protein LOC118763326 isoform X2 n=1 Tax=Octopus sinensis TaxID=2607531 RepID=A0A7E6EUH1_9MOLL|nr:uncharacterized protein LOC118763326 isoform X2 [Octopus sinensis]
MEAGRLVTVITVIPLVFLADNGLHSLEVNISMENETVLQYKSPSLMKDDIGKTQTLSATRKKRTYDVNHQKTASDANGICISHLSLFKSKSMSKPEPIHKVIVADEGTPVSLACHFCNDSNTVVYSSILWYQIARAVPEKSGLPVSEVTTDMKDDEKENRIIVTPTHTLIFKSIKEVDAGGYFCMARENMTTLIETGSVTHISNISNMLSIFSNISFFYHVDVLPSSEAMVKRVSLYNKGYEKPSEEEISRVRMVSKLNHHVASKPWFLDKVLSTYTQGVPCRSTLLREVKNITAKPDEIEVELCDTTCHRRWIYSDDNTQKAKITNEKWREISGEGKYKVVRRIARGAVGEMIKMDCPGTNLNSLVWWKNGTKTLNYMGFANSTDTRVQVKPNGNLIINAIEQSDQGIYSCWLHGKLRAVYKFIVRPPMEQTRGLLYHLPYIGTVLSFHFWVFVSSLLFGYTRYKIHPPTDDDGNTHINLHHGRNHHDDRRCYDYDDHYERDTKMTDKEDGYNGDTDDPVTNYISRNTGGGGGGVGGGGGGGGGGGVGSSANDNTSTPVATTYTGEAMKSLSFNDAIGNFRRNTEWFRPLKFTHDNSKMSTSLSTKQSNSSIGYLNSKKNRAAMTANKMSLSSDSDSDTIYPSRRFNAQREQQPLIRTYHLY